MLTGDSIHGEDASESRHPRWETASHGRHHGPSSQQDRGWNSQGWAALRLSRDTKSLAQMERETRKEPRTRPRPQPCHAPPSQVNTTHLHRLMPSQETRPETRPYPQGSLKPRPGTVPVPSVGTLEARVGCLLSLTCTPDHETRWGPQNEGHKGSDL